MMSVDLRYHWKTYLFFLVVGVFSVIGLSSPPKNVDAGHGGSCPLIFNRCANRTYFNNAAYSGNGTYVMSTGAPSGDAGINTPNVDSFVSTIRARLDDADPASRDRYQDSTGAAMIINTMLGHNGSDFADRNAGVVNARNRFGTWEARVRSYAARGLVDFNVANRTIPGDTINSLYDRNNQDDMFYVYGGDTQNLIVFKNTNGTDRYVIKKNCGNPIGDLQPLLENGSDPYGFIDNANCDVIEGWARDDDDLNQATNIRIYFRNQRTGEITLPYQGPAAICREAAVGCHGFRYVVGPQYKNGDSYEVWVDVDNIGGGAGPVRIGTRTVGPCTNFNIEMTLSGDPASRRIEPGQDFTVISTLNNTGTRNSDPGSARLEGDSNADAYATPRDPSLGGYPAIGPGGIHQIYTRFRLSDSAPDRAIICFIGYASPKTSSGGEEQSEQLCFTVYVPRRPYVSVYGGDTHAGAVLSADSEHNCSGSPPAGTGRIQGRTVGGNGSRSQYGLSAISQIAQFGSNNDPTGDSLTFGNRPGLGNLASRVICRPNYMHLTEDEIVSAGSYNVSSLAAGPSKSKIVRINGDARISGTLPKGKQLTILAEGNVYIDGSIDYPGGDNPNYGGAAPRDDIPALMIVARNNIGIASGVTRLTGYYVANGTISTCATGGDNSQLLQPTIFNDNSGTSTCGQQLRIYGLVEARRIFFRRTFGDARTGSEASELILFSPEMFLSAPPGLGGGGELQFFFDADLPPIN